MSDAFGFGSLGEFQSALRNGRIRSGEEIRDALKRMCDTVWGNRVNPAFWHIPANVETDVDCILYDAFTELERYRALFGPLPAPRVGEAIPSTPSTSRAAARANPNRPPSPLKEQ